LRFRRTGMIEEENRGGESRGRNRYRGRPDFHERPFGHQDLGNPEPWEEHTTGGGAGCQEKLFSKTFSRNSFERDFFQQNPVLRAAMPGYPAKAASEFARMSVKS
jgi:hypothetical protein